MIWRGIVSSSTIDKMFESYTIKIGPKFTPFTKIVPKFTLFTKIGPKLILTFSSKIGSKFSNILSMVDELTIC